MCPPTSARIWVRWPPRLTPPATSVFDIYLAVTAIIVCSSVTSIAFYHCLVVYLGLITICLATDRNTAVCADNSAVGFANIRSR